MADTPSTHTPTSNTGQSTSQLLDELDALMQRMLALPVQEEDGDSETMAENEEKALPIPEPAAVGKSIGPRSVNLLPIHSPAVTVQAPQATSTPPVVIAGKIPAFWPAPKEDKKSPPRNEAAKSSTASPAPAAAPMLPILLQRPKVPAEKRGPLLPPVPNQASVPQSSAPLPNLPRTEPAPPPRPVWLQTPAVTAPPLEPTGIMRWLVVVNGIFDFCTVILGAAGRWLRGEQGRAWIGLSGLVMLAAAVIWAMILFRG